MNETTYWDCTLPTGSTVRVQGWNLTCDEVMVMMNALQVFRETPKQRVVHRKPIRPGILVSEDVPCRL